MSRAQRPIRIALAAFVACCASVLFWIGFHAQRTLSGLAHSATVDHGEAFTLKPIEIRRTASPFEPVSSVPDYTSGAELEGNLYLAGPEGLTVLAPDGNQLQRLRTGMELPVAPVVAVATGRLRGAGEPQVMLATAGAGVVLLTVSLHGVVAAQQMLPAAAEASDISALLVQPTGDLILGTRHSGVLTFSGTSLEPLPMHISGVDAGRLQVTALAARDSASLLIGTRNQGAFYLHGGAAGHMDATSGLPDRQVEALAVSGNHAFVGTPLGVADYAMQSDGLHFARVLARGMFAHALCLSADGGSLNVGTLDQGVRRVALDQTARLHTASITLEDGGESTQRVDQFLPVPGAVLTLADGAVVGRSAMLDQAASLLTDRNVSALAFDERGALFVGYFDHGLDVLANGNVTHFEDDSLFCVNRLALDPRRKTMAAATANGLVLFDAEGAPRQVLTRRDGLLSDHVTDVAFSRSGTVLATPAGLSFIDATGTESLYAFQGLVNNHVYALAANPANDHVVAGTLGGLSLLDAEQVRRNLTVANSGLKHNWITALAQIDTGDWLVGTYGTGVTRLSAQGTFTPIDLPAGAPQDLVVNFNALLVTPTHIYAGTLGQGMLVESLSTGRWTRVTAGLPSLNVTAFVARNGELYIGTDNGLVRVAEATL